jgi:NADP-dependent 3-hydroxy acid dehydrogenase YdfG
MKIAPRAALVTGATGGIGRAIALALAERGARVCVVARRIQVLEELARGLPGANVIPRQADLTDDSQVEALAKDVVVELGGLDVLVHSAGTMSVGKPSHAPVADLDAQYRANVRAPYALTQALLPRLRESRGQVVFVNSSAVLRTSAETVQYTATQHARKAVADGLRDEVNANGIRVVSVFPGRTATTLQEALHELEGRPYQPERLVQPQDVATLVLTALELPRSAEVTDLHVRPFVKPPAG